MLVKLIINASRKTFALFKKRRLNTLYRKIRNEKTWSVKPQTIGKTPVPFSCEVNSFTARNELAAAPSV
jgi:hypothetical protein